MGGERGCLASPQTGRGVEPWMPRTEESTVHGGTTKKRISERGEGHRRCARVVIAVDQSMKRWSSRQKKEKSGVRYHTKWDNNRDMTRSPAPLLRSDDHFPFACLEALLLQGWRK